MKKWTAVLMGLLFVAAGINHFINEAGYVAIVPPWLPEPELLVVLSGIAEIALGIGLIIPATRRWAAWGIIALLVAVFPANIQMMLNYLKDQNPHAWLTILWLPMQVILIAWAYQYTQK